MEFVRDLSEILEEEIGSISPTTQLATLENWDSLNVLMVITHVNDKFGVDLPIQELANCQSVSDLCELVENENTV